MLMYVILARRWGEPDTHCYLVSVADNKEAAFAIAEAEEKFRIGEYQCEVIETNVCNTWPGPLDYKSIRETNSRH